VEGVFFFYILHLALAADGQAVAGQGDLQIALLDPGRIGPEEEGVLGLLDLEVRDKPLRPLARDGGEHLAEWVKTEQPPGPAEGVELAVRGSGGAVLLTAADNLGHCALSLGVAGAPARLKSKGRSR